MINGWQFKKGVKLNEGGGKRIQEAFFMPLLFYGRDSDMERKGEV